MFKYIEITIHSMKIMMTFAGATRILVNSSYFLQRFPSKKENCIQIKFYNLFHPFCKPPHHPLVPHHKWNAACERRIQWMFFLIGSCRVRNRSVSIGHNEELRSLLRGVTETRVTVQSLLKINVGRWNARYRLFVASGYKWTFWLRAMCTVYFHAFCLSAGQSLSSSGWQSSAKTSSNLISF